MGNKKSVPIVGYSDTPEKACKALEFELQKKYPNAIVSITAPDIKVATLSPRNVPRLALARIGDGKDYQVAFEKDENGVMARLGIP